MKIIFVMPKIDASIGWGRYAYVIREGLLAAGHDVKLVGEIAKNDLGSPFLDYQHPRLSWIRDRNAIQSAIDTFKPDVVHVIPEPYILIMPFIRLRGAKLIYTGHGTYAYPITVMTRRVWWPLYRMLFAWASKRVAAFIVAGTFARDLLVSRAKENGLTLDPSRVRLVPHGVDSSTFHFRERHYPVSPARILTVGQVKARKGIREAVRACAELKRLGVVFTYHIVGAYDDAQGYVQDLKRDIKMFGLEKQVVLCGRLSEEDKAREYEEADAFLLLPINDRGTVEGYGLVYLEANAYGIPTVGGRGSGAQDAIKEGVSGLLVDPSDAQAAGIALKRILTSASLSSKDARAWAEAHDLATWAYDTLQVYERA